MFGSIVDVTCRSTHALASGSVGSAKGNLEGRCVAMVSILPFSGVDY